MPKSLRLMLVVDEVHASDAYMSRLTEELLADHLAAGGEVLWPARGTS